MDCLREKNGGLGRNRVIQEQRGAEFPRRICHLEAHINREEKEIVTVKAEISEEIESAEPEVDTTEILLKAKEAARPSKRRRKLRVYFP